MVAVDRRKDGRSRQKPAACGFRGWERNLIGFGVRCNALDAVHAIAGI